MRLNPFAVVLWLFAALAGWLFSGGSLVVAGWCALGMFGISCVAMLFIFTRS